MAGVVSYPDNLPTVAPLFGARFEEVFGPTRKKGEELTQDHMDLAASVQRHCEHVIFHTLTRLARADRAREGLHSRWSGAEQCGQRENHAKHAFQGSVHPICGP